MEQQHEQQNVDRSTTTSTANPASDCSLSAEEANVEKEQEQERESKRKQSSFLVSTVIWIGSLVGDRIPTFLGGYECILIAHD